MTTIRAALLSARQRLTQSATARLDAQLLLGAVLEADRAYLLANPDQALTDDQQAAYQALIARRAQGEPVAYLLGIAGFYDRDFVVTPAVLIPRPESEQLVALTLAFAQQHPVRVAADIGTGSGALAVTVAAHLPQVTMHATDISPAALAVARRNAQRHAAPVHFHPGSLAEPLVAAGVRVDVLLANLPYIPSADLAALDVDVRAYEPHLALDGGADGLDVVRALLHQLPAVCRPGALALFEIGATQGAAALAAAQRLHPRAAQVLPDLAGRDRILRVAW